jgi:hypothetical protein
VNGLPDYGQAYVYRGDRWTDPALRGATAFAVKTLNTWGKSAAGQGPVCLRGRNGNMLVEIDGRRVVVQGRQLRKVPS